MVNLTVLSGSSRNTTASNIKLHTISHIRYIVGSFIVFVTSSNCIDVTFTTTSVLKKQ